MINRPNVNSVAPINFRTVPGRVVRLDVETPRPHCSIKDVRARLLGVNLDLFRDQDTGTLDRFWTEMVGEHLIPLATAALTRRLRTTFDWCHRVYFCDGTGTNVIVLPDRYIANMTTAVIRVLPSLPWYVFTHQRFIDGTEFDAISGIVVNNITLGIEPMPPAVENIPLNFGGLLQFSQVFANSQYYSGAEDADLLVDVRRHMIKIPPRVLFAGLSVPLWNYTFNAGTYNIELHYDFGFAPVSYMDGTPLAFDAATNIVIDPKAAVGEKPASPIDWSSGMPAGIREACAMLTVNAVLRARWRALSNGLSSISVDGASESYGSQAYGGDLDKDDEEVIATIANTYGRQIIL